MLARLLVGDDEASVAALRSGASYIVWDETASAESLAQIYARRLRHTLRRRIDALGLVERCSFSADMTSRCASARPRRSTGHGSSGSSLAEDGGALVACTGYDAAHPQGQSMCAPPYLGLACDWKLMTMASAWIGRHQMISKEWSAEFHGHHIAVANGWNMGLQMLGPVPLPKGSSFAKLYIDGECVDTNTEWFGSYRRPSLRGRIELDGERHVVEVFMTSWSFTVKAKICIDGREIPATVR